MHIEFLLEEPSAEAALRALLPRLLTPGQRFTLIHFSGKQALLRKLDARLRGYARRRAAGEQVCVVVLLDRDADDCAALKAQLEMAARKAGLHTKSRPGRNGGFVMINRIVVEELESWFLGDPTALRRAFPSLPPLDEARAPFRNPDNGGTWQTLHRLLRKHGIYTGNYPKIEAARRIAAHLDPANNRSASFRVFREGVHALVASRK